MNNIDFPENLYKFGCFDSERHYVDLIKNNTLYLSCPEDFNDPFDCAIAPDFENFTYEQFYEMIKIVHQNSRSLREINPTFDDNLVRLYWNHKPELAREYKVFYKKALGVCCFSEKKDNILMWSHYSQGHRGFCLEFDDFKSRLHWEKIGIKLNPVTYSENYPSFTLPIDLFEWAIRAGSTKSCIWSYEKEWRLMHPPGGARKKIQYEDSDLKSIYLGVGCKEGDIEMIRCLIRNKNPKPILYRAKTTDYKYKIEFDIVSNE